MDINASWLSNTLLYQISPKSDKRKTRVYIDINAGWLSNTLFSKISV